MDYSLSGSSVHGILQLRTVEWVGIPSSRGPSQPRDRTRVSHIAGRFFTICAAREALAQPLGAPRSGPNALITMKLQATSAELWEQDAFPSTATVVCHHNPYDHWPYQSSESHQFLKSEGLRNQTQHHSN